jgi:Tfp pilus assembly protein PilX
MKKKVQHDTGFILMIIVLVLLVIGIAGLAFFRVQQATQ